MHATATLLARVWMRLAALSAASLLLAIWTAVALPGAGAAHAQSSNNLPGSGGVDYPGRRVTFTDGELQRLPDFCRYQQGPNFDTQQGLYYRQVLGVAQSHIHHYCRGLRDMFFARVAPVSAQVRRALWDRALDEMNYMVRNTPQDNTLMPEVWYQRGEVLLQLRSHLAHRV